MQKNHQPKFCILVTPWTAARQASLSITNSQSLFKLMSVMSVMPSNHLILCRPLLLLPSIFPSIRVFSNESVLHIKWSKYWNFSFSISPSNEYSGLISFRDADISSKILGSISTQPPTKNYVGVLRDLKYLKSIKFLTTWESPGAI